MNRPIAGACLAVAILLLPVAHGQPKGRERPAILDPKEPLKTLVAHFVEAKGTKSNPKATEAEVKRDLETLNAEFGPKGQFYEIAVKRKLIGPKSTKLQVDRLIAAVWLGERVGPKATPFNKPLDVKGIALRIEDLTPAKFTSDPDGATVYLNGLPIGSTSGDSFKWYVPATCKIKMTMSGYMDYGPMDYTPATDGDICKGTLQKQ